MEEKTPVVPEEKKPEETPAAPAVPATPETPPAAVPPANDKGTQAPEPETKPEDVIKVVPLEQRPVAFIPVDKYNDQIRIRDEKITELQKLVEKPATAAAPAVVDEPAMQAWADKNGLEPDAVTELIALLPKSNTGAVMSPEEKADFDQIIANEKQRKAAEFEVKDWNDNAVPTLKELFPSATEAQLKAAQDMLNPIAHTEEGVNLGYDVIVFRNRKELSRIFADAAPATPELPANKATLESGKMGTGSPSRMTAKDFSGDKPDFTLLEQLSPDDSKSLIKSFDGQTYKRYLNYVATTQPLEIDRGGAKIKLK